MAINYPYITREIMPGTQALPLFHTASDEKLGRGLGTRLFAQPSSLFLGAKKINTGMSGMACFLWCSEQNVPGNFPHVSS